MHKVDIYTDGSCSKNPGPGGWCAILVSGEHEAIVSGYMPETTNNRMELFAVIAGLQRLKKPCNVEIFSDSTYVVNAFNEGWIHNWQKKSWKNVKNDDLWRQLLQVMQPHNVSFNWVKGHADNEYNNRCDKIAVAETQKYIANHS